MMLVMLKELQKNRSGCSSCDEIVRNIEKNCDELKTMMNLCDRDKETMNEVCTE